MLTEQPPVPDEIDPPCDTVPAGVPWFEEPQTLEGLAASTRRLSDSLDRLEIRTLHRVGIE